MIFKNVFTIIYHFSLKIKRSEIKVVSLCIALGLYNNFEILRRLWTSYFCRFTFVRKSIGHRLPKNKKLKILMNLIKIILFA